MGAALLRSAHNHIRVINVDSLTIRARPGYPSSLNLAGRPWPARIGRAHSSCPARSPDDDARRDTTATGLDGAHYATRRVQVRRRTTTARLAHYRRRALTDPRRSPRASEAVDDQAVREGRRWRELKRRPADDADSAATVTSAESFLPTPTGAERPVAAVVLPEARVDLEWAAPFLRWAEAGRTTGVERPALTESR